MKICPKCGMNNKDDAKLCMECSASLHCINVKEACNTEEFFACEERKDRRKKRIHLLMIPLYYVIYITFFVLCLLKTTESIVLLLIPLLFPALYYLSIFHPDAIFRFQHMFDISNLEDVEPSDWYYFSSKLGGYLILVLGLFIAISCFAG